MPPLPLPIPVKLFIAAIYHPYAPSAVFMKHCVAEFGEPDYMGSPVPFEGTDYYTPEMGSGLLRFFFSFGRLIDPESLPAVKIACIALEDRFRLAGGRLVNLDCGYLDYDRVVLASTKSGPFKLYLGQGIWGDMTLHYEKRIFIPFPWTFADFKTDRYHPDLMAIRELYRKSDPQKIRSAGSGGKELPQIG
jgi:hypothetical protein